MSGTTWKKPKETIYYGIAGANGQGVYTDKNKLMDAQKYLVGCQTEKFSSYENAKIWAEAKCEDLYRKSRVSSIKKTNYTYYRRYFE